MNAVDRVQDVSRYISTHVSSYFPNLDGEDIRIRMISEQHRASASLYQFEVESREGRVRLFAKGVTPGGGAGSAAGEVVDTRPRLSPGPIERGEKTRLEYHALDAIYQYFHDLNEPSLGAIRVLDFIAQPETIIMVENSDPPLRSLYAKANRLNELRGKSPDLKQTFFNAGRWLKTFSELPKSDDVETRLPGREEYQESIARFTRHLGEVSGNERFFRQVKHTIIPAAEEVLPDKLPLGLGHGDYAMRNLLVGPDSRVTAFDTCARWRVPIFEDIAYFLNQLETNGLQVLSQGLAVHATTTAAYRQQFLAGYFGDKPIPVDTVRLFQVQLLLDSWSSQHSIHAGIRPGAKGMLRKAYFALLNQRYKTVMEQLLGNISIRTPGVATPGH